MWKNSYLIFLIEFYKKIFNNSFSREIAIHIVVNKYYFNILGKYETATLFI